VITYKVSISGLDKIGETAGAMAIMRVQTRAEKAMQVVIDAIDKRLDHIGSGRIYKSSRSEGGKHQASAPGESPAADTYALSTSFSYEVRKVGNRVLATIESALWHVYGRRLELGGSGGGSYIAPRPYIRPAMDETDERVQRILDGEED
jgi:hypothetical protein